MQMSVIFLILLTFVMLTQCRPARLVEENGGESAEAAYEGNDDNAENDYFREDQESVMAVDQQRSGRRDGAFQDPQEQGDFREEDIASDQKSTLCKDGHEPFSKNHPSYRNGRGHREYINLNNERGFQSEKEQSQKYQPIEDKNNEVELNDFYSRPNNNKIKRKQNELSMISRNLNSAPDYGNELLFKMKSDQVMSDIKRNREPEDASATSGEIEQYYNNMRRSNQIGGKRLENENNYERDRRHIQNDKGKQVCDSTSASNENKEINVRNENSENAIIKNIKKLSEQDLEELLNSLPDDKRALLKKIMDKREITKKAGAVDENSYLEGGQSDTSKIEVGYSVDLNTESSLLSNTPETSKHTENGEIVNTKNSDCESGSRAIGSKSELNESNMKDDKLALREESESSITDTKSENIQTDLKKNSKIDSKRQTKIEDVLNEKISLEDSVNPDPFDSKHSNDLPQNKVGLYSLNENWLETKNEDPIEINSHIETLKREVSQNDQSNLQVKSLEDSFPADRSYDENNLESEMAPLIRVKRTEKDHLKNIRDTRLLSNVKEPFSSGLTGYNSEDCENEEKSELEDSEMFNHQLSNFVRNDQYIKSSKNSITDNAQTQSQLTQFIENNSQLNPSIRAEMTKTQFDKISLGSDTDSVLSGIEGVNDNLMYNSGLRRKRASESTNFLNCNADKIFSSRNARTVEPLNVISVWGNSINEPQYKENEAFRQVSRNSEDDVNRYKRVRQINPVLSSQELNS